MLLIGIIIALRVTGIRELKGLFVPGTLEHFSAVPSSMVKKTSDVKPLNFLIE